MRNKEDNIFDKIFRDKLTGLETTPGVHNWEIIDAQLKSDKPNRWLMLTKVMGVAATLTFLAAAYVLFSNYNNTNQTNNIAIVGDQNLHSTSYLAYTLGTNTQPQVIIKEIYKEVPVEKLVTTVEYIVKEVPVEVPVEVRVPYAVEVPASNPEALAAITIDPKIAKSKIRDNSAVVSALPSIDNDFNVLANNNSVVSLQDKTEDFDAQKLAEIVQALNRSMRSVGSSNGSMMALTGAVPSFNNNHLSNKELADNIINAKMNNTNGFHFGATSAFNNTWILSKKGSISNSENEIGYKPYYGGQYGVTMGYSFGNKYGLQLDWIMNSNHGQNFSEVINGKETTSSIKLNYMHIPVLFKYKWNQFSQLTKKPVILNYIFGVQYSALKSVASQVDDSVISLSDLQRDHDWGVVIGLDYDIFLSRNYYVSVGARSTYGSDFGSFGPMFNKPASTKTDNLSVGLTASMNYMFGAKN